MSFMDNQKLSEKIDYAKEWFGESILPEIPRSDVCIDYNSKC
jgi:hypothetical protein